MPLYQPLCSCNQARNSPSKPERDPPSENCKSPLQTVTRGETLNSPWIKVKLSRRHSDPGPKLLKFFECQWPSSTVDEFGVEIQPLRANYVHESQAIQSELEKDETLSHLLQEIRNLRQINRKLSVELFHTKMLLQIAEQNNHYSSEPGSASALVRKLIDSHNAKYDFNFRMPASSREMFLRFGSASPKPSVEIDDPYALQRECEGLKNRLRAMENKLKEHHYSQGGGHHHPKYRPNNGHMAASADCLSSTLASPSSSTLTSFEDMNPPLSLNGLDSEVGRPNWAPGAWPRVPPFYSTRPNGGNAMENFNSSYLGAGNFANSHGSLEESKSMDAASCDARCSAKHFRSNLSSLI